MENRRYLYLLTGTVGETVTDLSQRLLAHHGGLRGLLRWEVMELAQWDSLTS
jgi:DNA repair protein RadC